MRRIALILLAMPVALLSLNLGDIVAASDNLKSVEMTLRAENHTGKRVSVVELKFWFKRPDMMRLEYTYPRSMKGSIIAVDGKYFYSYIPSLNRKVKKKLGNSSKNPGKDMGFLYEFVKGDLKSSLKDALITVEGEEKIGKMKAIKVKIKRGDEMQMVWLEKETLFPVAVEIYRSGKLRIKLEVKDFKINPEIDDSFFLLF